MGLSPEQRDIFEDRLESNVEQARDHAGSNPKQAAAHFSKAADLHERLAADETSQQLADAHYDQAETLRSNARSQLRDAGLVPSESDDSDSGTPDEQNDDSKSEASQPTLPRSSDSGSNDDSMRNDETVGTASVDDSDFFEAPPEISLDDVGGLDAEISRVQDGIIKPQRHPEVFEKIGVEMSNGVLLHGPPGTGKSLLTRAVANELEQPYAEVSAAELGSEYVNKGAQNIQALFSEARTHQPCVVFIDELDSLARSRSGGSDQTNGTRQMITQLLQELDAIQGSDICVIGATNLIEDIDGAIRRSGRFDRKIHIGAPDDEDRREIFEIHLEDKLVEGPIKWEKIIEWTEGFSGADIAKVVREAGQRAASQQVSDVNNDDITTSELRGITYRHLLKQIKETEPGIKQWRASNDQPATSSLGD